MKKDEHDPKKKLEELFLEELGAKTGSNIPGPAGISERDFDVEMTAGGEPRITRLHKPLVGIALSGGGIRSAIFNLGVLQGLAKTGILKRVNYLATVSGGGYVGGFWSSWRHAIENKLEECRKFPDGDSSPDFRDEIEKKAEEWWDNEGGRESRREFKDPSTGEKYSRLQPETKDRVRRRMVDIEKKALEDRIRPVFPVEDPAAEDDSIRNLRAFSNFLIPRPGLLNKEGLRVLFTAVPLVAASLLSVICLGFFAVCLVFAWYWLGGKVPGERIMPLTGRTTNLNLWELLWIYLPTILCVLLLLPIVFLSFLRTALTHRQSGVVPITRPRMFLSKWALITSIVASAFALGVTFSGKVQNDPAPVPANINSNEVALIGLVVFAALLLAILYRTRGGSAQRQRKEKKGKAGSTKLLFTALPLALSFVALVLISRELISFHDAYVKILGRIENTNSAFFVTLILYLLPATVLFLLALRSHPTVMSMHQLYRSRISRAYLGSASRGVNDEKEPTNEEPDSTEDRTRDDIPFTELKDQSCKPGHPLHLVCCAANDLAGDPLKNLNYGATNAVLSRHGLWAAGSWRKWAERENMQLSSAITASAAAFNTQMGSASVERGKLSALVMGALNLRLGLWVRHPLRPPTGKPHLNRFSDTIQLPGPGRFFPGWLFFCEMFSRTRVKDCYHIHLSDGGHFEIFGLYELVRRHCRYIIVSEAGVDPAEASKELGNSFRKIRTDLGVEIDLDVSRTGPGSGETVDRHVAVGKIKYPEGSEGIIIYLRTGISGDEPVDVLQYRNANPEFPYQKTGDQFFDAAQWEAYRRLGEHIGRETFDFEKNWMQKNWLEKGARKNARLEDLTVDQVFINTKNRWKMLPGFMQERLIELNRRSEAFARDMLKKAPPQLIGQVYPEVTEIVANLAQQDPPPESGRDELWEEKSDELKWVRLVAVYLEGVWRELDVETYGDYPELKPWFNYFRRWTGVEAFRKSWWVMRTILTPEFADFLEKTSPEDLRSWEPYCEEYPCEAGDCGKPGEESSKRPFCYRLWSRYTGKKKGKDEDGRKLQFEVGKVSKMETFAEESSEDGNIKKCRGVKWHARDFEIKRRYWGVGIATQFGRAFIRALVSRPAPDNAPDDPREEIEMRVELDTAEEKFSLNDQIQFYHGLGFEKAGDSTMVLDVRKWYFDAVREKETWHSHGHKRNHREHFTFGLKKIKTGIPGEVSHSKVKVGRATVMIEDHKTWRHSDALIKWKSSDFKVEPDFWNLGIGTLYAAKLVDHLVTHVIREMAETFKTEPEKVEIRVEIDKEDTWPGEECRAFYMGLNFEEDEQSGELVRRFPFSRGPQG